MPHACASDRAYPCFVGFLDERQHMLAENALRKNQEVHALFWGGHGRGGTHPSRCVPSFLEPDPALFPVESLGFSWRGTVRLTHRDFLGTMLGCGIKREKIGDILCGEGTTAAFVHEDVAGFLSEQIVKIGGEGVTVERPFPVFCQPRMPSGRSGIRSPRRALMRFKGGARYIPRGSGQTDCRRTGIAQSCSLSGAGGSR